MRILLRIIAVVAVLGLWLLAAATLWHTQVPRELPLPDVDARDLFSPRELRESAEYKRVLRALWVASVLAQLAVLAGLAARGPLLAARLHGGRLARGLALLLVVLAALWLVRLPFGLSAHWWRRRHGISRQPYLDWLLDPWLELLAGTLLAAVALAVAMTLALRLGRRWWLAGAPALALLGAASVLAQPLVMAPRLEPLEDARLAADIRELGRTLGIEVAGVEVKRASERTTRVNAEVAGIGPTRRVVLWDTLLDGRVPEAEIRFVAAHELAHVSRDHLWKGVAWLALLAPPLVLAVAEATRRRGGVEEPGAVPLAVLVVVSLQLALLPLVNAVSRRYEAEADWVALEATRDPDAARGFFRLLVRVNLAQPQPPGWARVVLGTHPPLVERIALAGAWAEARRTLPEAAPAGSGSPRGSTTSTTRRPSRPSARA